MVNPPSLPTHARVVIVGGGVIGTSIAYHLAALGWQDVVLLERAPAHRRHHLARRRAHGHLRLDFARRRPRSASTRATSTAASRRRPDRRRASCRSASSRWPSDADRLEEYPPRRGVQPLLRHRRAGDLAARGRSSCSRSPGSTTSWPASTCKEDGRVNPVDVTMALGKGARMRGAKIFEGVPATGVPQQNGRVTGVSTPFGDIRTEYVVNCAGMWAREFGALAGVTIPNQAAEHYYLITEAIKDLPQNMPVLEDPVRLRLLPRGRRRPDGRPVRARLRAVEDRGHPDRLRLRRPPARLGSHGAVPREGHGARADHHARPA